MKEEQIHAYLKANCLGKKKAVRGARLAQIIHTGEKEIQKVVARLRRKGIPIASGPEGYYYAANAGEVYATIRLLKEMVEGLLLAIRGLEAALERFGERGDIT